jgi:hypothetical protein
MVMDVLKEELTFFDEKRQELLRAYPGQFALIKGQSLIGIFSTIEQAYTEGATRFGREAFLIKHIVEHEAPELVPLLAYSIGRANI